MSAAKGSPPAERTLKPINDELYFLQRPVVVTMIDEDVSSHNMMYGNQGYDQFPDDQPQDVLDGFAVSYGGYAGSRNSSTRSITRENPTLSPTADYDGRTLSELESDRSAANSKPPSANSKSSAFEQYSAFSKVNPSSAPGFYPPIASLSVQ